MRKLIVILMCMAMLVSSCTVTRTNIGTMDPKAEKEVFAQTKQMYLFWGLVPLGNSQVKLPDHNNVQIKTAHNGVDLIATSVTGGIFSMVTIKCLVKKKK